MLATVLVPLVVLVVGVLVYALAANPKLSEIGRIVYFVGLFWIVAYVAKDVVRF